MIMLARFLIYLWYCSVMAFASANIVGTYYNLPEHKWLIIPFWIVLGLSAFVKNWLDYMELKN